MWKAVREAIQTTGRTLRVHRDHFSACPGGLDHVTALSQALAVRLPGARPQGPGPCPEIPPTAQPFRRPLPVAGVGGVKATKSDPRGGDNGIRPPQGRLPSG